MAVTSTLLKMGRILLVKTTLRVEKTGVHATCKENFPEKAGQERASINLLTKVDKVIGRDRRKTVRSAANIACVKELI